MASEKERQASYRERRRARGLCEVIVWAPCRDRERIKRYAAGLSETFEKEQRSAKSGTKER